MAFKIRQFRASKYGCPQLRFEREVLVWPKFMLILLDKLFVPFEIDRRTVRPLSYSLQSFYHCIPSPKVFKRHGDHRLE